VAFLFLLSPVGDSRGLDINIDTAVPEYILDDYLELTGGVVTTQGSWNESLGPDFQLGTIRNLTVQNDDLLLVPGLEVQQLNNGNPVLRMGTGSDWDSMMVTISATKVDGKYYIYYQASTGTSYSSPWAVGVASSNDGLSYTKYSGNPILRPRVESYDYIAIHDSVVMKEGDTWKMWYAGDRGIVGQKDVNVCYATSVDGLIWTKRSSNPVMANNVQNNAWNGTDIRIKGIIKEGASYRAFVCGDNSDGIFNYAQLGMATSIDGLIWSGNASNPLYGAGNGWEGGDINYGNGEAANGTYRVWTNKQTGPGQKIGYTYSMDGVNWQDSGASIISPVANTIYEKNIRWPAVIDEGDHYIMYAQCHDWNDVRTYGAFKLTPQKLDGTYTSRLRDFRGPVRIGQVTWRGEAPNGTWYEVHVRYGNTTTSLSAWKLVTSADYLDGVTARYLQYKVEFKATKDWMRGLKLDWLEIDYTEPLTAVQYRVDDGPWSDSEWGDGTWSANVSLHDGDYDVEVRAVDSSAMEVVRTLPVRVDLRPPMGELQLEGGNNVTHDAGIDWLLMASDTHGVPRMRVSTEPDLADVPWVPFTSRGVLDYTGPDGNVTVYAEIMDGAGRTAIVSDSIWVDTKAPTGNLTINGGAKWTWNRTVTLDITWENALGLSYILVSNHAGFSTSFRSEPVYQLSWDLLANEGVNIVYVRLVDSRGRETVIWSSIILDLTPPFATFFIDGDRKYTSDREVTLDIWEEEKLPVRAVFANGDVDFTDGWQEIVHGQAVPWTLLEGPDGPRTVRMLVRDAAGHEKVVVDTIVLDRTPPSGELLFPECPEGYTGSQRVMVRIAATDELSGVVAYRFGSGDWEAFEPFINVTLQSVEGLQNIGVELMDGARNQATLLASIVLDTTAPTGRIIVANGSRYVNYLSIPVELQFEDDGSGLSSFSNMLLDDAGEPWIEYTTKHLFAILAGSGREDVEGAWNIIYYVRDRAGNVGEANATVIVDLTAPGIELRHVGGGRIEAGVNEFTVVVWDEFDLSPTVEWRVDGKEWRSLDGNGFEVDLDTGEHTIEVRALDAAGNMAEESVREEVTLSLVVTSTALLLVIVIFVVAVLVYLREGKRMQDMERER